MDFHKLTTRYQQFGGLRLVWEYAKLGLLGKVVKSFFRCLFRKQSFKKMYSAVQGEVKPFLTNKYNYSLSKRKEYYSKQVLVHQKSNIVWFCWLQGLDQAPDIVKVCYNSLVREFKGLKIQGSKEDRYEIKVIDAENWKEYIEFPDYIVRKWEKKQMPPALFSDLLRLQLLIKYGGAWIDSTVLCTGFNGSSVQELKKYLDADLFLFQYTQPGEKWSGNISNWFITAHSNNEILMVLRDMLFDYWKDYSCTLYYYIFHLFFKMVAKEYPDQIAAMPYGYSVNSLMLLHHWGETFDQRKWDRFTYNASFHKLAFRVNQNTINKSENFYNYILKTYLS